MASATISDIPELTTTTFNTWCRQVYHKCLSQYGDIARVLIDPDYTPPSLELKPETGVQAPTNKAMNIRAVQMFTDFEKNQPLFIGMVISKLSEDLKARVTSKKEFLEVTPNEYGVSLEEGKQPETSAANDIVKLIWLIKRECNNAVKHSPTILMEFEKRLNGTVLRKGQSIDVHIANINDVYKDGDVHIETRLAEEAKIAKFYNSLRDASPSIYEKLMFGEKASDLTDAYDKARNLYAIEQVVNPPSAAMVMVEDKVVCKWCEGLGRNSSHAMFRKVDGINVPNCYSFKKYINKMNKKEKTARVAVEDVINDNESINYPNYTLNTALISLNDAEPGEIFLDTCCSAHWFKDLDLFEHIAPCNVNIRGIGGTVTATHVGKTKFGRAYYGNSTINLLSVNQLYKDNKEKKVNISIRYRTNNNTFVVHGKDIGRLVFSEHPRMRIPYAKINSDKVKFKNVAKVGITEDCGVPTNPRLVQKAKRAVDLHVTLNHPNDAQLSRTLNNGGIINSTVTASDIQLARRLFGPCPGCAAGKSVNHTSGGQYNTANTVAQHVHCDIVYVPTTNGKCILYHLSADEYCTDILVYPMENQLANTIHEAQMKVINHYRTLGFAVDKLYYDDGTNISATRHMLEKANVQLVQAPATEHDKQAESAFRTIKSSMRSVLSALPYRLPVALLKYLMEDVALTRSLVTTTNSGAQTPHQLTHGGESIDATKILKHTFGEVVSMYDESHGQTFSPRITYGIIVGRDILYPGKYTIWVISSQSLVHRNCSGLTTIPINDHIRDEINRIADKYPYAPQEIINTVNAHTENPYDHFTSSIIMHHRDAKQKAKVPKPTSASMTTPEDSHRVDEIHTQKRKSRHNHTPTEYRQYNPSNREARTAARSKAKEAAEIVETIDKDIRDQQEAVDDTENHLDTTTTLVPNDESQPEPPLTIPDVTHDISEESTHQTDSALMAYESPLMGKQILGTDLDGLSSVEIAVIHILTNNVSFIDNITANKSETAFATNMTLNQMLNQGKAGEESATKEITQILDRQTWHPIHAETLSKAQKRTAITCHGIGAIKRDGTNKTRVVAGGHKQDKTKYTNMVSPTSSHLTTMVHLTVSAYEKRPIISQIDYPGAYLGIDRQKHDMPQEIMRVAGKLAQLIIKIDPSYKEYEQNGSFYVVLDKSLYGLIESAALWYKECTEQLEGLGYRRSLVDPCLFHNTNGKSSINIHVDDFLCSFKTPEERNRVHAFFESKQCKIAENTLDFLHMRIERCTDGSILIDMEQYITSHLDKWGVTGIAQYPANDDLFDTSEFSEPASDPKRFVSIVMALMYVALRTRPDILLTVSFLATRCSICTVADETKLDRLLRYLRYTATLKITIRPSNMRILTYADASYNVHSDAKGHSGYAVTIGDCGALITAKSSKQKPTSKSSCEAELIAADLSTTHTVLAAQTLAEFGYDIIPELGQDNEGTISLAHNGRSKVRNTKHINTRYFAIKELIDTNQLDLLHVRTNDMIADMLTKPLTGSKFIKFRARIMNINH